MPGGTSACPGCGLERPRIDQAYDRKFHASAECWALFEEVIAAEFQSPMLFGRAHQLTVDAYAVQHAGGAHPDKSVCVHAVGLCLVLEKGVAPTAVAPRLQRLAGGMKSWPHLALPAERATLTIEGVVLAAGSIEPHVGSVRAWAAEVWRWFQPHHEAIRALAKDL